MAIRQAFLRQQALAALELAQLGPLGVGGTKLAAALDIGGLQLVDQAGLA